MSKKNKRNGSNGIDRDAARADNEAEALLKSERDALSTVPPDVFTPEGQRQRWMKYGGNVVLTSVIVILLAAIAIWAFNANQITWRSHSVSLNARKDLTSDASNELKPQTIQLIKDLPSEVTLVSLYPKLKKEDAVNMGADTYQKVRDILDEYQRNSKNIKVELIDPIEQEDQVAAWLIRVKQKYSKNTENYEKFVKDFPATLAEIKTLTDAEAQKIRAVFNEPGMTADKLTDAQVAMIRGTVQPAFSTVLVFPKMLQQMNEQAEAELQNKIPDYAAAVQSIKTGLSGLSDQSQQLIDVFKQLKDTATAPAPVKKYAGEAVARFEAIKAKADESVKKSENLGELKLDDVRQKILPQEEGNAAQPAIAIMGENDIRVIQDSDLWTSGQATGLTGRANEKPKLRFSGEQRITSSILALSQPKKQKVAFIRAGGPPLASGMSMMGMRAAPFSVFADRLRGYNFDVVDKDILPPQGPQRPQPGEATDESIKSAIWVVFSNPAQADPRTGMPMAGMMGERLRSHLEPQSSGDDLEVVAANEADKDKDKKKDKLVRSTKRPFTEKDAGDTLNIAAAGAWKAGSYTIAKVENGVAELDESPAPVGSTGGRWEEKAGSALCLISLEGEDLAPALKDYGIEAKPNVLVMHERVESAERSTDFIEQARREPAIFILNEFGNHPITSPLRTLDAAMVPLIQVKKAATVPADVAVTEIIPIPDNPKSWGETNLAALRAVDEDQPPPTPKFDKDDVPSPLFAGAAAEKAGKGRVVVIGALSFAANGLLTMPDPKSSEKMSVTRFPGNAELLTNSIFWLAQNEKMMALSPAALETARIASIEPAKLGFIKIGLVLIVLPMLAVGAGVAVWMTRRG